MFLENGRLWNLRSTYPSLPSRKSFQSSSRAPKLSKERAIWTWRNSSSSLRFPPKLWNANDKLLSRQSSSLTRKSCSCCRFFFQEEVKYDDFIPKILMEIFASLNRSLMMADPSFPFSLQKFYFNRPASHKKPNGCCILA